MRSPGRIITFYSYKGGTGRSMALANMAWVLASRGKRVLMVDWDLEAPGLHRYFHPFLEDQDLTTSKGVIDFVIDFVSEAMTPASSDEPLPEHWYVPHANILRYAFSLNWQFPDGGTLDFVPAGRQDSSYAIKVNAFNWQSFYEKFGGGAFLEAVRERMRREYDYVLIDSRTGVSDTSGICTVQMPDVLVICFTLNNQSIEGAAAVARAVHEQRSGDSGQPGIKIFPVPTRVERAEKERMDVAREVAWERFDGFLSHFTDNEREIYWGNVEVFYEPFYAYEEVLATFRDRPFQTSSMLASIERLTGYVTEGEVDSLEPPLEEDRERISQQFMRQRPAPRRKAREYLFFLSYSALDRDDLLDRCFSDLLKEVRRRSGSDVSAYFNQYNATAGETWSEEIRSALENSLLLVPLVSPSYIYNDYCGKEFEAFRLRKKGLPPSIFPVLWVPPQGPWPSALSGIQWMDSELPEIYAKEGLRFIMRLRKFRDDYELFLARFAQSLVAAAKVVPAAGSPIPPLSQIKNAFQPGRQSQSPPFPRPSF